jgi:DNA-binding PadR family transcriptional regulator
VGLFGLGQEEPRRGPRVRRGDVRSAILDVLRTAAADESSEAVNGYQVIQQIAERSGGAWRPSPGSVYPTIQLLQDEGLVETDDERTRKTLALTAEGTAYVAEHADELAAVWAPFERRERDEESGGSFAGLKPEIGQVMGAVWQIVTSGSESQQRAAIDVLVETRRKLYGILADGHDAADEDDEPEDES